MVISILSEHLQLTAFAPAAKIDAAQSNVIKANIFFILNSEDFYKSLIFLNTNMAINIAIGWIDEVIEGLNSPFSAHISKNGSVI